MSYFIIARSPSQVDAVFETVTQWMRFVRKKNVNAIPGPFLGVWFDSSWDGRIPKELPAVGSMTAPLPIVSSFSVSGLWALCQIEVDTIERDVLFQSLSRYHVGAVDGSRNTASQTSEQSGSKDSHSPIFAEPDHETIRKWTTWTS